MLSTSLSRRSGAGFSLIEAMVSVAVVVILAALLMAGIQKATQRKRATQCLGNLRQISVLMQTYLADHRMVFPQASYQKMENGKAVGSIRFWGQQIAEHAGLKDLRCFVCPEVTDIHPSLKSNAGAYGFGSVSYGINRYGVAPVYTDAYTAASLMNIREPAKVLLMLDYDLPSQPYDGWYVSTYSAAQSLWDRLRERHQSSVNALFCDGHVRPITGKEELIGSTASDNPWAEFQAIPSKNR